MKLVDNVLLTHVGESYVSTMVDVGLSLASKVYERFSLGYAFSLNRSISAEQLTRRSSNDERLSFGSRLGYNLILDDDMILDIIKGADPFLNGFSTLGDPSRLLYMKLIDHPDYADFTLLNSNCLETVLYMLDEKYKSYDLSFNAAIFFTLCICQYVLWCNGIKQTYDNLTDCFSYLNGYASKRKYLLNAKDVSPDKLKVSHKRKSPEKRPSEKRLMKYFTIAELSHSNFAASRGLDNTPPNAVVKNLMRQGLFLDDVREAYGSALHVNSGYRSTHVNQLVGGVEDSSHTHGLATDLTFPGKRGIATMKNIALDIARKLQIEGIKFDQIIYYDNFIHFSVSRADGRQSCAVFQSKKYSATVIFFK